MYQPLYRPILQGLKSECARVAHFAIPTMGIMLAFVVAILKAYEKNSYDASAKSLDVTEFQPDKLLQKLVSLFEFSFKKVGGSLQVSKFACGPQSPDRSKTLRLPALVGLILLAICGGASAETVEELKQQKDLTPVNFIRRFADFKFELGTELQDPAVFLKRRCGDCDDFARLAAATLKEHGFKTKIVVVMMARETHVVCYVEEAKGYLDFNHRADAQPIVESTGSLEDIAAKVAADFRADWRMASEVRFENSKAVYVDNVFFTRPAVAPAKVATTPGEPKSITSESESAKPHAAAPPKPEVASTPRVPASETGTP